MPLRVLYFDLRLCWKLCASPFLVTYLKLFKSKLFLPEWSAVFTYHISPEAPISWLRELEVDRNSSFHFVECAIRGIPCPPMVLLLLVFKFEPWPLYLWPQCSEIWLQQRWGMRPSYGLDRFRLQAVMCTLQRWDGFVIRKVYIRELNEMCKGEDIFWYPSVSFSAILSYQTPLSSPPPSLSFVICWLKILELLRDLGRG